MMMQHLFYFTVFFLQDNLHCSCTPEVVLTN